MANKEPTPVKIVEEQKVDPVPVKPVISGSLKEMVTRWLFEQSVSTVLLIAILAVVVYGVPNYVLPSIGEGYKSNADTLERTMKQNSDSRERVIQLLIDSHDRDREVFKDAIRMK